MRKLLLVAVILSAGMLIVARPHAREASASVDVSRSWDLRQGRSPQTIGWPDGAAGDYWTDRRAELTVTHPSGKQLSFANVEVTAQRERGQLTTLRLSLRDLSHAEMVQRSRSFCDAWDWPASFARLCAVYPTAASAKTGPQTWLAQTRGVSLRVTHEGLDPSRPWSVEFDWNLRPQ